MPGKGKGRKVLVVRLPKANSIIPNKRESNDDHAYVVAGPSSVPIPFSGERDSPWTNPEYPSSSPLSYSERLHDENDNNKLLASSSQIPEKDGKFVDEERAETTTSLRNDSVVAGLSSALSTSSQVSLDDSQTAKLTRAIRGLSTTSPQGGPQPIPDEPVPNYGSAQAKGNSTCSSQNLPSASPACYSRKPPQQCPIPGQIFHLPDGRYFPDSVIHKQKRQNSFFLHPVLIILASEEIALFYALTTAPPKAILELNMYLCIGSKEHDEGQGTLKLARGSKSMMSKTAVNLEQCYAIEWENLDMWACDVRINPLDLQKLYGRIIDIEAKQNRFIYKPLPRDMSGLAPGTVIMLPNGPESGTKGAPVMILENRYPYFFYLRVKQFEENPNFNRTAKHKVGTARDWCLEITQFQKEGHDNTPVMLLEPGSPETREHSYVELKENTQFESLDKCRTWCWPPVRIQLQSLDVLRQYHGELIARLQAERRAAAMNCPSQAQTWQFGGPSMLPGRKYGPAASIGGQPCGTAGTMVLNHHMPQSYCTNVQRGWGYEPAGISGDQRCTTAGLMSLYFRMLQNYNDAVQPVVLGAAPPVGGQIHGTAGNMAVYPQTPQAYVTNMYPWGGYQPVIPMGYQNGYTPTTNMAPTFQMPYTPVNTSPPFQSPQLYYNTRFPQPYYNTQSLQPYYNTLSSQPYYNTQSQQPYYSTQPQQPFYNTQTPGPPTYNLPPPRLNTTTHSSSTLVPSTPTFTPQRLNTTTTTTPSPRPSRTPSQSHTSAAPHASSSPLHPHPHPQPSTQPSTHRRLNPSAQPYIPLRAAPQHRTVQNVATRQTATPTPRPRLRAGPAMR